MPRTDSTPSDHKENPAGRAAWICLIIAWVAFIIPIPGIGFFLGWPLNLVAFILAIVAMAKRGAGAGIWPLLASLVVSPLVYWIALGGMFAWMATGSGANV